MSCRVILADIASTLDKADMVKCEPEPEGSQGVY